jgi:hypothetical protein
VACRVGRREAGADGFGGGRGDDLVQIADQFDRRRIAVVRRGRDDDPIDQGAGGFQRLGGVGILETVAQPGQVGAVGLGEAGVQLRDGGLVGLDRGHERAPLA